MFSIPSHPSSQSSSFPRPCDDPNLSHAIATSLHHVLRSPRPTLSDRLVSTLFRDASPPPSSHVLPLLFHPILPLPNPSSQLPWRRETRTCAHLRPPRRRELVVRRTSLTLPAPAGRGSGFEGPRGTERSEPKGRGKEGKCERKWTQGAEEEILRGERFECGRGGGNTGWNRGDINRNPKRTCTGTSNGASGRRDLPGPHGPLFFFFFREHGRGRDRGDRCLRSLDRWVRRPRRCRDRDEDGT